MTFSEHMPLLERLRKAAPCVVFLDGDPGPAADVADMLRRAADRIEQLQLALEDARDALRNDFEPDNQSAAYKRADAALKPMPTGPAGDRGQVGWMGGEFDR